MTDIDEGNLVFLLSMPRSGSSLLGLILSSHPEVCCPPEPWIQLMLAEFASPKYRIKFPYDENAATIAVAEFVENIVVNEDTSSLLTNELRILLSQEQGSIGVVNFAKVLYGLSLATSGKRIFVDKTPRYHHTLDFIDDCYPAAKKILLTRNPLDIALSYKKTWQVPIDELVGQVPTANTVDFAKGLFDLARYGADGNHNVHVIAYEDLVRDPEGILRRLCKFLDIGFSPQMLIHHQNATVIAALQASSVGDRNVLLPGRKTDTSSIGGWRQELSREEIARLVSFLGGGVFSRLHYQQTIEELVKMGIKLPEESRASRIRATAVVATEKRAETRLTLIKWAYLIASMGVNLSIAGELVGLLFKQSRFGEQDLESLGGLILDLVGRCRQSESMIGDLTKTNALKKTAHVNAATSSAAYDLTTQELVVIRNLLSERTELLEQSNAVLLSRTEELVQTRQALTERTAMLEQSNAELLERTEDLVQTRQTLTGRTVRLEQAGAELLERTEELVATRKALTERTALLEQSNAELLGRTEDLVQTRQGLAERSELLEQTSADLLARMQELVAARQTLAERTAMLEQSSAELLGQTQDLMKTRKTLIERTEQLKHASQIQLKISQELEENERVLMSRNSMLESSNIELAQKTDKLNALSAVHETARESPIRFAFKMLCKKLRFK